MHEICSRCGLQFEQKSGDVWGFWILTDRVFLFVAIAALYLGFRPESWTLRILFLAVIVVPLVATMPHRQGAFVALDYLARVHWR